MSDKPIPERWRNVSCAYYDDRVNDQMVTQLKEELGAAEPALLEAQQDRDTWRRVAERLETEKLDTNATIGQLKYVMKVSSENWLTEKDRANYAEAQIAQLQAELNGAKETISQLEDQQCKLTLESHKQPKLVKHYCGCLGSAELISAQAQVAQLQTTLQEQEERQKELVAALEPLLETHCCDDGAGDFNGATRECEACIPARNALAVHAGEKPK